MLNFDSGNQGVIGNFYRRRRLGDKILLTTEHGSWLSLERAEFRQLSSGEEPPPGLKQRLLDTGILICKDNLDKIVEVWGKKYRKLANGANLHIIVPTIRCNQHCVYCHSAALPLQDEHARYDMNTETVVRTLEFIFRSPSPRLLIEFQGGEPLLNKPVIKEVIRLSRNLQVKYNKEFSISLVTNLLAMDEDFFQFILANRDIIQVTSSLDGPRELHNHNRALVSKNGENYDNVIRWYRKFQERQIPVTLLMVTTRYSLPYWKEIIDQYVELQQSRILIKPLDNLGYAARKWPEIGYTIDEFNLFWKKAVDYTLELKQQGKLILERYFAMALNKILTNSELDYPDWHSPCGMIRGQIVYNHNGDIYPCDESRVFPQLKLGNVHSDSYRSVLLSEKARGLLETTVNDVYYCDSCAYKPYCGVCSVLTYQFDRDFRIKLNKTDRCQRYKFVFDYVFDKIFKQGINMKALDEGRGE